MKIFTLLILAGLTLGSSLTHAQGKVYGSEIFIQSPPVRTITRLMKKDTVGSTADSALNNAISLCDITVDKMIAAGAVIYSYRPYALIMSSGLVWSANCEAGVPK